MSRIAHIAAESAALYDSLLDMLPQAIETAVNVQQIPAPTFQEAKRAAYVCEQFKRIDGLRNIEIDGLHNVYARLPGTQPDQPAILVSAHTDTVFDQDTDLTIHRQDGR